MLRSIKPHEYRSLLDWFFEHRRRMPWRLVRDPYCIWVSEIMLQQTQVVKVIDYYTAFIARFPTVQALAEAPLDAVMAMWSGLGYYSRCRNLHACAQFVVAQLDGHFPSRARELEALPGIGPYTARSIASICFGERVGVVDGNIKRVMARLHNIEVGFEDTADKAKLQIWMDNASKHDFHAGDVNEAWMELGATVCTPKTPDCPACPVQSSCAAKRLGTVHMTPRPRNRARKKSVTMDVWLEIRNGKIALTRQEETGLFHGLYVLPKVSEPKQSLNLKHLGTIQHILTHRNMSIRLFQSDVQRDESNWTWLTLHELEAIGRPRWVDKALEQHGARFWSQ